MNLLPDTIDSSMMSCFRKCAHKFYWEYVLHLAPPGESIDLIAGAAFADGLAEARRSFYERGSTESEAMADGLLALTKTYGMPVVPEKKQAKAYDRVLDAYDLYFAHYPMGHDPIKQVVQNNKALVEFTFAVPLPIQNPSTGNPFVYAGKYDWVGEFRSMTFNIDEKTTGAMGPTWASQWDLRSQFIGYAWGSQQYGLPVKGTIVRGVCLRTRDIEFRESIIYTKPWLIERWYDQLLRDIGRIVRCWETNHWDYDLGDACASFGGCAYEKLCAAADPTPWINLDYETRIWNPLVKEEF